MRKIFLLLPFLAIATVTPSLADECYGIVLDDFNDHKAGEVIAQLHADEADALGLPETYAVHGGGVYPAKKIHLLNCHIVKKSENKEYPYDTILDDTLENQPEIRRQRTEAILSTTPLEGEVSGLSYASASNLAWEYALHPGSACSQLIDRFLVESKAGKTWSQSDWEKAPCGDLS